MIAAFTIKAVAARTGLSTHTIRAWERRYGVLSPQRTETNRRLFTLEDVERLSLLKKATDMGHAIGAVAGLTNRELQFLCAPAQTVLHESTLELCLQAVERLDATELRRLLTAQANEFGLRRVVDETVVPLLRQAGSKWHEGTWSIAHEHLASAVVRAFIDEVRLRMQPDPRARRIVACTLAGQMHEFGALLAALEAVLSGWNATFLGASLPPTDVAEAVNRLGADALAVSLSLPIDAESAERQLTEIRANVGPSVSLIVGGPAVERLRPCLERVGALVVPTLGDLRTVLGSLSGAPRPAEGNGPDI